MVIFKLSNVSRRLCCLLPCPTRCSVPGTAVDINKKAGHCTLWPLKLFFKARGHAIDSTFKGSVLFFFPPMVGSCAWGSIHGDRSLRQATISYFIFIFHPELKFPLPPLQPLSGGIGTILSSRAGQNQVAGGFQPAGYDLLAFAQKCKSH